MEESNKNKKFPFDELAKKRGYAPEKLKSYRENCKNVSHILKGKNSKGEATYIRIDLKKIKNKKQNEDWLWLEFKNPLGNPGWLHGDADFIVFERTDEKIKDTYTGEILGNVEKKVAKATIIEVDAKFSVAEISEEKYDLSVDFKPR